jgi:hypothetical protein
VKSKRPNPAFGIAMVVMTNAARFDLMDSWTGMDFGFLRFNPVI